eukprot:TRINITY_DN1605_c0_g1_i1.p1 TRINITY_DN1605_c0_g1~~TRINITY_DN1605_c0_g1_i1.p1  ORF type:complete len:165 (+),score=31.07 TRINITY_DN1605_c0_g1_i1:85-579(+)
MMQWIIAAACIATAAAEQCSGSACASMPSQSLLQRAAQETGLESLYGEEIPGYTQFGPWSEVCGKGCSSPGMTCIYTPMSTEECAKRCDALPECVAFQMPADNGFHHWCVWFSYEVKKDPFNRHYCHDGNYIFAKEKESAPEPPPTNNAGKGRKRGKGKGGKGD